LIDAQHVNPPYGAELKRTRVSSGDILISITADIGRIALVPEGVEEAYVNQHVALAKSVSLFDRSYLAWYLISPSGQAQLTNLQYGATKAGLGLEDIGRVKVPFPPLVEQRLVVEEIERILASTKETKQALLGNLKRSQTLRESILKTAFEGRLVPQDPTDDPAEKLLELIKSERLSNKSKNSQTELSNYVK
jgi:type I restriction enzyme S subunit